MDSVWSYPDRGAWGNPRYRGNASGYVYRDLYRRLQPRLVVDPCVGGGTSVEVARDEGIEAIGLDLHSGFNLLRDSILEVVGRPGDLVVSHLPYHDMIRYTGNLHGAPHPDDLSRCADVEDFLLKAQQSLLNQRDATAPGRHYATLIGDLRRNGRYWSFQAEFIARMPADELVGVIIKGQHNVASDQRQYRGSMPSGMPRIGHEYLIVWRRPERSMSWLGTLRDLAWQGHNRVQTTWRAIVRQAMVALGGEADLPSLYRQVAGVAESQLARNANWQAKVRQVLQRHDGFRQVQRGRWALA